MSRLSSLLAFAALITVCAGLRPAFAGDVYEYRVEHPLYGEIGTYTNIVDQSGGEADIETKLNIAVKLLGVVVHREEAERRELWQNDRLTLFRSLTTVNGQPLAVAGEARGDAFVITSPAGTVDAPADIRPTNPWSLNFVNAGIVMSTKSGRIFKAHLDGVKDVVVTAEGKTERLREFDITTDKHQSVWMDDHNVPVAFRTEENGTPIDFVLMRYPSGEPQPWKGPERPAVANPLQQTASGLSP
ncbi:MAG TPA: DUF6134 family protein [Alphaproteobacteria bacterium]|nr:DUF6134 family protein [Alphaproteobacteria bacterium]